MNSKIRALAPCGFPRMALVALVGWAVLVRPAALAQQETDLFRQARAYENLQNYPAAENIYRKVLASDPNDPEALKRLGILEQTELKFSDSIEHFRRILLKNPDYPQVNFLLGVSFYAQHRFIDSIASLQHELKTPTAHPNTGYLLALSLEGEGRMNDAIDQLNKFAAKNPKKANALYELARLHMAATFQTIDELRLLDPDSFEIHAIMGELYSQEANYDGAVQQYQAALKKQPDANGIHASLGVAYFMLNQYGAAEREMLLALQEAAGDSIADLYLGNIALHQHEFNKALPYLQQAVASRPKDVESHLLLGRCYLDLGDLPKAKDALLVTASLDRADPRSHYLLAEVYQKLNQPTERQKELDLFNKLTSVQKAAGAADGKRPPELPDNP
jgi:tetratricopeptide (TPR) repeat protein